MFFYAESLAQVVSLDTENKHRLANPETNSQHIAMLFDGLYHSSEEASCLLNARRS